MDEAMLAYLQHLVQLVKSQREVIDAQQVMIEEKEHTNEVQRQRIVTLQRQLDATHSNAR